MKQTLIMIFTILVLSYGCGKSDVDVSDSKHTIDGTVEAFQYVIVQFDFIKEIKELCTDIYAVKVDLNEIEKKAKAAECTFDYLSVLDTGLSTEFTDNYCTDKDLYNKLSLEDQLKVDELCNIL